MSKEKEKEKENTDSRRSYILRVAGHILSLHLVEEKLPNIQALYNFCDTPVTLFVISRSDQVRFFYPIESVQGKVVKLGWMHSVGIWLLVIRI